MNYQDRLTKFTILRPLKSTTAEEVAYQLMDIFCTFGAPFILQERQWPRIWEQNNAKLGWYVARNEARAWKAETFWKSRISWKDPTKMFETCWLLGCPITTQKPDLKDYDLSKARRTELCIEASRQALVGLCLELRRGSDLRILPSLKACILQ